MIHEENYFAGLVFSINSVALEYHEVSIYSKLHIKWKTVTAHKADIFHFQINYELIKLLNYIYFE